MLRTERMVRLVLEGLSVWTIADIWLWTGPATVLAWNDVRHDL